MLVDGFYQACRSIPRWAMAVLSHPAPNQFIEVYQDTLLANSETPVFVVSGLQELTGFDESGIFYRFRQARLG